VADERFLYFVYGSNMLTRRLRRRTSSAQAFGPGYVPGYRLTFAKVSKGKVRNSGKCDMEPGAATDRVHGVLFSIARAQEQALDDAEGGGYDRRSIDVITPGGKETAVVYVANEKDPALRPYHWYKAFVVAGAVEHGLPAAYVEWLRTFESQPDTDNPRRTENEAIPFRELRFRCPIPSACSRAAASGCGRSCRCPGCGLSSRKNATRSRLHSRKSFERPLAVRAGGCWPPAV
jgi:gamma-glutamylcyclotransferase